VPWPRNYRARLPIHRSAEFRGYDEPVTESKSKLLIPAQYSDIPKVKALKGRRE